MGPCAYGHSDKELSVYGDPVPMVTLIRSSQSTGTYANGHSDKELSVYGDPVPMVTLTRSSQSMGTLCLWSL